MTITIPRSYWREVPCGHPMDPVALIGPDGIHVCHCGRLLDKGHSCMEVDGMPIVHCQNCGCHVGCPEESA